MLAESLQKELKEKYNPEGSDLRRAQLRMLDLLIFLDKICKENNLTYWLEGGTLLGAVRHGGFIPWDDDTDVCMPREDAMKLKKIMGDGTFEGHIVLQNHDTDPHYINSSWMTLRDTKSEYIKDCNLHNSCKYKGLQVDIFIVDKGVSPILKRICAFYQIQFVLNPWLKKQEKLLRPFVKITYPLLNNIVTPILRLFKFNNIYDIGYGCQFIDPFCHDTVFPLTQVEFEGHFFSSPRDKNKYLTNEYGDWEKIPNPDKIKTHHVKFKFLE